jgi:hypothetical protein
MKSLFIMDYGHEDILQAIFFLEILVSKNVCQLLILKKLSSP